MALPGWGLKGWVGVCKAEQGQEQDRAASGSLETAFSAVPPSPHAPRGRPCPQECILRALQAPSRKQALARHLSQKMRARRRAEAEEREKPAECPGPGPQVRTPAGAPAARSEALQPVYLSEAGSVTGWQLGSASLRPPPPPPLGPSLRFPPQFPLSGETGWPLPEDCSRPEPGTRETPSPCGSPRGPHTVTSCGSRR